MKIVENKEKYAVDFIRLNEEWITKYFYLEESDYELAANPMKVVSDGGYIFTLLLGAEVVGCCALFNEGDGIYELARMAVSAEYHGNGYAKLLMNSVTSKLQEIKANKVYLISNTELRAPISMYKKYGFETISLGQHPVYVRANIVMERAVLLA